MKKTAVISVLVLSILLSGCSFGKMFKKDGPHEEADVVYTNDAYVNSIQSAKIKDSKYTYKEIFEYYFTEPEWKHFAGEKGQEVVEFTGECQYKNQKTDVKLQFVTVKEGDNYKNWETAYIGFNGENQSLETLTEFFEAAIEKYEEDGAPLKNVELSKERLSEIAREKLKVPDKSGITYSVSEKFYSQGKDRHYVSITFYENGKTVASANLDVETGELLSGILEYTAPKIPEAKPKQTAPSSYSNTTGPNDGLYRVRISWDNQDSQIGAFAIYDNAKALADKNKSAGYKVYDSNGRVVYAP